MNEFHYHFGVRFRLEDVTFASEQSFNLFVVSHDAIMYNAKQIVNVGALRVRIHFAGNTVRCPSCMSDSHVQNNDPFKIQIFRLCEQE